MENRDHAHVFEHTVVPATCKSHGYTLHRCACGYEYKDCFTMASSHTYEVVFQEDPTCTAPGKRQQRCTLCGDMNFQQVPPLGHSWGEWNLTEVPTCTEEGAQYHICGRCGTREDQAIPARGHSFISTTKSATQKGMNECFCQNCGQTILQPIFLRKSRKKLIGWSVALSLLALLAVFAIFFLPKTNFYHYQAGKLLIKQGKYEDAYYQLLKCKDHKGAETLLEDFILICGKTTRTNADGDSYLYSTEEYDSEHHRILSTDYYSDGSVRTEWIKNYDGNGNLIYSSSQYTSVYMASHNSQHKYTYDDQDQLITEKVYDGYGDLESRYAYTYDSDGNQTSETYYDSDGSVEWKYKSTYDSDGNQTSGTYYDSYGSVEWKYKSTYDSDGNQTSGTYYDSDGSMKYKYEYTYDSDGSQTSGIHYDGDGNMEGKYKYTYDSDGNLTSETYYDGDGNMEGKYKYTYDSDGNQTSETYYDDDGRVEYKYEYDDYEVIYLPIDRD